MKKKLLLGICRMCRQEEKISYSIVQAFDTIDERRNGTLGKESCYKIYPHKRGVTPCEGSGCVPLEILEKVA